MTPMMKRFIKEMEENGWSVRYGPSQRAQEAGCDFLLTDDWIIAMTPEANRWLARAGAELGLELEADSPSATCH